MFNGFLRLVISENVMQNKSLFPFYKGLVINEVCNLNRLIRCDFLNGFVMSVSVFIRNLHTI